MKEPKFLEARIKRQLRCNGVDFEFVGMNENKFNEKVDGEGYTIRGIYHENSSWKKRTSDNGAVVTSTTSPMILCLYKDGLKVSAGDKLSYSGNKYIVVSKNDIQGYGVVFDISLEEVKNE